jgi:hypothetical protein
MEIHVEVIHTVQENPNNGVQSQPDLDQGEFHPSVP